MAGKPLQGKYKPENPHKYKGDINNIVYRSSWEKRAFVFCDRNPRVIMWCSEEIVIPYWHRATKKRRRYFTDLMIKYKHNNNEVVDYICEIKPYKQTIPPVPPKRQTEKSKMRFIKESLTYQQNQDKWNAAEEYCKKHGLKFIKLTEHQLGIT